MRSKVNIPFACEDDGALLDVDTAELVISLGLVRNTQGDA